MLLSGRPTCRSNYIGYMMACVGSHLLDSPGLTAAELHAVMISKGGEISLGTVRQKLKEMEEANMATRTKRPTKGGKAQPAVWIHNLDLLAYFKEQPWSDEPELVHVENPPWQYIWIGDTVYSAKHTRWKVVAIEENPNGKTITIKAPDGFLLRVTQDKYLQQPPPRKVG